MMLNRHLLRWLPMFLVATICITLHCGCQSSASTEAVEESAEEKPAAKRTKSTANSGKTGSESVVASTGSGKPLTPDDVWFPDPIKVALDKSPLGAAAAAVETGTPTTPARPAGMSADTPKPEAPAEGGTSKSGGWDLVTANMVTGEVKQIKTRMAESLSNVNKYNGQYKKNIRMDASVLAAIATIVGTKNDGASWKGDAKYVRDLSSNVIKEASGLEKKHYDATKTAWEDLDGLLSGNKPAKLPDSAPEVPFSETVNRGGAMLRMDKAYELLKQFSTADALKKNQELALHEAAILAVMTKVVASPGYPDIEEEDYQKIATAMEQYSVEAMNAAKEQNFAAYGDALSRMGKSCTECHTNYKG